MQRLVCIAMLCGCCEVAIAAQVAIGRIIVKTVDSFRSDATQVVLPMCSVQEGVQVEDTVLSDAIAKDVDAMMKNGAFSYARADVRPNANGMTDIVYTVARRTRLTSDPVFVGHDDAVSTSKLQKEVKLELGDPCDDVIAQTAALKIRDYLIKEDYPHAEVTPELKPDPQHDGYATLIFNVKPGDYRPIRGYEFTGNTVLEHDTLARTFGWAPWWDPRGWFSDLPQTDASLDDARMMVRDRYLQDGYLDVVVEPATFRKREGSDKVDVVFAVKEGPQYTIGTVSIANAKLFTVEELMVDVNKRLAQGRIATTEALNTLQDVVEMYYGRRGYVDTRATLDTVGRASEPNVIDVKLTMHEGERVTIRAINIAGNSLTRDKVIRRELLVMPGDDYNSDHVRTSENRLKNMNYFSEVTSYTTKTETPGVRDLTFAVRDMDRTGDFGFGIAASSVDNVFGYASISKNNFDLFAPSRGFHGGGQRASIGVELGGRRQTIEASWTEPWLFDRRLSLTVDGYRRVRWYDHYDEIRTGAAVTLAWHASLWGFDLDRIGFRYKLEQVGYKDEDDTTYYLKNGAPFRYDQQEDGINSKLRFFWNKNTRNRAFIPTRGTDATIYMEAGLGGDSKTYGLGFSWRRWFNPWWEHVIMLRARFDTIEAYSGDVPMFDRLFLGGGRLMRGFEYRDMGPKAYSANRSAHGAIGGQTSYCGTVEYTIPLFTGLRFATFCDVGAVGEDEFDFSGDLTASMGFGFRIDFPDFPIRIDFAWPLINDDDTEEEIFTFILGLE